MSYELVKLSVAHKSVIDLSDLNDLISEGEAEVSEIEEKIENVETLKESLQDEIDELNEDIKNIRGDNSNLDDESNEYQINLIVIGDKENEITILVSKFESYDLELEKLESEKKLWQDDIDHIQSVIDEVESYRADSIICANHINDYIKDQFDESELEDVSNVIRININWDGVVEDCKQDYSYLDLDGYEYYYLCG